MTLDQKRIAARRNALIPCYKHKPDGQATAAGSWQAATMAFATYKKLLASTAYRLAVLAASLAFLAAGIYGCLQIRQKFNPVLFLPADSYLRRFVAAHDAAYPSNGWSAELYTGRLDHRSLAGMEVLITGLQALVTNGTHLRGVDPWWPSLKDFARAKKNFSSWQDFSNPVDFPQVLGDFLFSTTGSSYKHDFKFEGELTCGEPAPGILASKFTVDYLIMDGPEEHIPARQAVEQLIAEARVSDTAFSHVKIYAAWETDEIIGYEYRFSWCTVHMFVYLSGKIHTN